MKEKLSRQFTVRLEESSDIALREFADEHRIAAADLIRAAMAEKLSDWKANGLHLRPMRKPRTAKAAV